MKTKHIVTKESNRATIQSGSFSLLDFGGCIEVKADTSSTVKIDCHHWISAKDLRATAKLFKKLADALEREEVL